MNTQLIQLYDEIVESKVSKHDMIRMLKDDDGLHRGNADVKQDSKNFIYNEFDVPVGFMCFPDKRQAVKIIRMLKIQQRVNIRLITVLPNTEFPIHKDAHQGIAISYVISGDDAEVRFHHNESIIQFCGVGKFSFDASAVAHDAVTRSQTMKIFQLSYL